MATKEPQPEKIEAQIIKWSADLGKLTAKAEREVARTKERYYEQIEALRRDMERRLRKWETGVGRLGETAGTVPAEARRVIDDLRATMDSHLKTLGAEVDRLREAAAAKQTEAKRMIGDFRAKREAARERVRKLREAGDEAWGEIRTGLEKAWHDLRGALENAVGKFR